VNQRLKFCLYIYFGLITGLVESICLNKFNVKSENEKYDTYIFLFQFKKIHFYVKLNYKKLDDFYN